MGETTQPCKVEVVVIEKSQEIFNKYKPDMLKIDCEGAELDIFKTADLSSVDFITGELHLPTHLETLQVLEAIGDFDLSFAKQAGVNNYPFIALRTRAR